MKTRANRGTAVITGGSRGIGAAVARAAGTAGYGVMISFNRDHDAARAVVEQIQAQGGRAAAFHADAGSETAASELFEAAESSFGPVRLLVNNAGITGNTSRLEDLDLQMLAEVLRVNVFGCFAHAREAARRMSTNRGGQGGSIINVSSRAGQLGGGGLWIHYAASKAAIDALTVGLSQELGREGVRVNAVAPGLINTDLHARAGVGDRLVTIPSSVPLGRAGTPEEVAATVMWLASDAASYLTGAIIPVSGGR